MRIHQRTKLLLCCLVSAAIIAPLPAFQAARSGADAIDLYIQQAPDVTFLDIGLPDMSGHDILARLLELDRDAYIVMLSGQGNRENVLHAMQRGAKGFIGKPFTPEKLFSYVHKCPFVQEKRKKAPFD